MTINEIHGIAWFADGIGFGVVAGPLRFYRRRAPSRGWVFTLWGIRKRGRG